MDRRMFGKAALALATTQASIGSKLFAEPALTASEFAAGGMIDTHTHFYDPTRKEGVPWPSPGTSLYRPVYPKDWLEVASPLGVTKTLVVEASARLEDNQWILDLAQTNPSIVGLIGNLDPADAAFSEYLKRFVRNPLFRGIRWRGDKIPANADNETFNIRAKALAEHAMVLELNGGPPLLLHAAKIAQKFPNLSIMIDHVGGAGDASQLSKEWLESMKVLGDRPNVSLKVSALNEQTRLSNEQYGKSPSTLDAYLPILEHCWSCFGDKRLIYGSDWPVCEKGGSYGDQFVIVKAFFDAKGKEAAANYFQGNAVRFYGIKG